MDEGYKRSHLGAIMLVLGLVSLLGVISIGGFMLVAGASKVFATIPAEGTHTVRFPKAGEYVFARDANIQPDDEGITVTPITEGAEFGIETSGRWIVIGEQRHKLLGTIDVPKRGDVTLEIAADAYPITIRHEPMAMARRVLTTFGILIVVPIALTVIGIVVAIRNTNKRNRFISEQMI